MNLAAESGVALDTGETVHTLVGTPTAHCIALHNLQGFGAAGAEQVEAGMIPYTFLLPSP